MVNVSLEEFLQWKCLTKLSPWQRWPIQLSAAAALSYDDENYWTCWINDAVRLNRKGCQPARDRGPMLRLPLRLIDTFTEGRNKVQPPYLSHLWYGEIASCCSMISIVVTMMSWFCELILSISQSRAATSGWISTVVTNVHGKPEWQCVPSRCSRNVNHSF